MLYNIIFILLVIYFAAIEGQDRQGWPEYISYPEIKGWLKIHLEPADFETAGAKCRQEGAQLLNPHIPEFLRNAKNLMNASSTAEKPISAIYSISEIHYHSGWAGPTGIIYSNGEDRQGWPGYISYPEIKGWLKIHLEPADFETARATCRKEDMCEQNYECVVITSELNRGYYYDCDEKLPFICYAWTNDALLLYKSKLLDEPRRLLPPQCELVQVLPQRAKQ